MGICIVERLVPDAQRRTAAVRVELWPLPAGAEGVAQVADCGILVLIDPSAARQLCSRHAVPLEQGVA